MNGGNVQRTKRSSYQQLGRGLPSLSFVSKPFPRALTFSMPHPPHPGCWRLQDPTLFEHPIMPRFKSLASSPHLLRWTRLCP